MSASAELAARTRLWLRALFHRRGAEREMEREMQFHLDMEIEQLVRSGMSLGEARRTAILSFGGLERHKESVRDERGTRIIEELVADVRQSARAFRARPGFTATAAITMAVGIAASTSVFSVVNWILTRPVPGVSAPREMVRIDFHEVVGDPKGGMISPAGISYPNFIQLKRGTPGLRDMAACTEVSVQLATMTSPPGELRGAVVIGDYFGALGVRPEAGRFFDSTELRPGSAALLAVISDSVWRAAFGAAPNAIGRTVRANGGSFTVIGVAPPGFHGIDRIGTTDVWFPAAAVATLLHSARLDVNDQKFGLFMDTFGRLDRDATPASVEGQMRGVMAGLVTADPSNGILKSHIAYVTADLGIIDARRQWISETLRLLAIVAGFVLLISCANAANLLLLRGVRRRSELAVRRALGATMGRLIRQQVVEGLLLSLLGAGAGIVMTLAFRAALRQQSLPGFPPLAEVPIDLRVVAFALGLSLVGGIVFATIPALFSLRFESSNFLRSTNATDRNGLRTRRVLAIAQIAACTALVVGGALLGRTLHALNAVDIGFDPDRVASYTIDPKPQGYDREHVELFRRKLVDAVRAVPGVDDIAIASQPPLSGSTAGADLRPGSSAATDWPVKASTVWIQPTYFATLRIPIIAGSATAMRNIEIDSAGPDQVVISRSLATALFGAENPLGQEIVERAYRGTRTHIVAAVAADVRGTNVRREPDRTLYAPIERYPFPFSVVLVRASRPRVEIDRAVRAAIDGIDPFVPMGPTRLLSDVVARSIAGERLFARILTLLALISAILTAAGIYGIIAHSVAERTREIGVRVALGATTHAVVSLVTGQVVLMVVAGLAIGAVASVWFSRLLAHQLFGVTPLDPASYAFAGLLLLVLGMIAAIAPARTAAQVNPVDALRHE